MLGEMAVIQLKPSVGRSLLSTSIDGRSVAAGYLNYRLLLELQNSGSGACSTRNDRLTDFLGLGFILLARHKLGFGHPALLHQENQLPYFSLLPLFFTEHSTFIGVWADTHRPKSVGQSSITANFILGIIQSCLHPSHANHSARPTTACLVVA